MMKGGIPSSDDSPRTAVPAGSPTPRRRFRYSLRTLLLVFLVVSLGLGWFTARMRKAARQRAAVSAITSLSGVVSFDDEPAEFEGPPARSPAPRWLKDLLGDDFFRTAVRVLAFNNGTMEYVADLPELRRLDFVGSPATDAGLVHVRWLSRLEELNLADTQITDAGLEHLQSLTRLRRLHLRGTQVTDAGVKRLQQALPDCQIQRYAAKVGPACRAGPEAATRPPPPQVPLGKRDLLRHADTGPSGTCTTAVARNNVLGDSRPSWP